MSRLTVIILILLPLVGSYAQTSPAAAQTEETRIAEARRRVGEAPAVTNLNSPTVSVPMVGTKTLPLVEVSLNGKGPYRFLVDSGANVTLLQMRVADELKLPVLRPGEKSRLLALGSLQIGDAHFQDLVVGARAWDENIDGVIGFNLFADCLLTMDYPHQRLMMRKGNLPPANGKDIFKYGLDRRNPTLDVNIGHERLTVLIDTGAVSGLIIPDNLAAKFPFIDGLQLGPSLSTFAIPRSQARTGRLAGDMVIGIHYISKPVIHVWSDEIPLIGSGILQHFILTFDQKNQTMRVSV